jgi:phage RecT family recombinase
MTQDKLATIDKQTASFLAGVEGKLATYAPEGLDVKNFLRLAQIAILDKDDLAEMASSEAGQKSVYNCLKLAVSTGLSLNPMEGKACMIVRSVKNKKTDKWEKVCTYQIEKGGLIQIALESGVVESITADTVRENDEFNLIKTPDGDHYKFSPDRKNRGEIDGYFVCVKLWEGQNSKLKTHTLYMTDEEVTAHRKEFSAKSSMPKEGYALKTIIKKCLRNLHISADVSRMIRAEDKSEAESIEIIEATAVVTSPGPGASSEDARQALADKKSPI